MTLAGTVHTCDICNSFLCRFFYVTCKSANIILKGNFRQTLEFFFIKKNEHSQGNEGVSVSIKMVDELYCAGQTQLFCSYCLPLTIKTINVNFITDPLHKQRIVIFFVYLLLRHLQSTNSLVTKLTNHMILLFMVISTEQNVLQNFRYLTLKSLLT